MILSRLLEKQFDPGPLIHENRYRNRPLIDTTIPSTAETIVGRIAGACGNNEYGPKAFQAVDARLVEDLNRIRSGQPLEPLFDSPKRLPPAIIYNPIRRGVE